MSQDCVSAVLPVVILATVPTLLPSTGLSLVLLHLRRMDRAGVLGGTVSGGVEDGGPVAAADVADVVIILGFVEGRRNNCWEI